jgi:hypothetical protein
MVPDDSGGLTGGIVTAGAGGGTHIDPRFHVQTHPWIPVSIVCVVLPPVISPQVQLQFQFQTLGRLDGAGAAAGVAACAVGAEGAALGVDAGSAGAWVPPPRGRARLLDGADRAPEL